MIDKALKLVLDELNQYIPPVSGPEVVLGNIAFHDSPDLDELTDKLVMCLVNIEEESTLKNIKNYQIDQSNVLYKNPPVHLNLYILFCANYTSVTNAYERSLQRLSQTISFFQGKNVFTLKNTTRDESSDDEDLTYVKMIFELYTLTFEQINFLWGSLGGKQMPFAMYKVRLLSLQRDTLDATGRVIEEIKLGEKTS